LLALASYLADTIFLIVVSCVSWQLARATQMVTQYRWLYQRTSPFTWRRRTPDGQGDRAA
jgi:hypothetical protein